MKKTTLVLATLATVTGAYAQNIGVTVDGEPVRFNGTQPMMANNSVLVPLRGVFEQIGAQVLWNQGRQEVTAIKGDQTIRLGIGERFADINGRSVRLNTPARVVSGSTLVPLRFLSEALGARVTWNPNNDMVAVTTLGNEGRAQPIENFNPDLENPARPNRNRDRDRDRDGVPDRIERRTIATLENATVLPVRLDEELSSNQSRRGDRFTATLDVTSDAGTYANLPSGTKIEGRVVTARPQRGDDPGLLELSFDRIILPGGQATEFEGTLVNLNDKGVKRGADGRLVATGKARNNRGVYAGYGAGAGLIVGLLTKRPLENAILGGLLGFGLGSLEQTQKENPSNVRLRENTRFGVRLDEDVTIYRDR